MKILRNGTFCLWLMSILALPGTGFSAETRQTNDSLAEPAKTIYEHYLAIQTELARDSVKGLTEHANAISKAAKSDDAKLLPVDLGKQADELAKAKDLKTAREGFKPLSKSLIDYLAASKAGKGFYHEAYCPMVKASWLQKGQGIRNPYMGKQMLTCGELKN